MQVIHLAGLSPYAEVHTIQERLVAARLGGGPDTLLLLEHAPTITVGRKQGSDGNVLAPAGVPVVRVERGGDVTWHGPGQLVGYPIIGLEGEKRDLRAFLAALEQAVIAVLRGLGLDATRDPRNTGVWLPGPWGERQKVCSIGVACRQWVTWHGFALNRSGALDGFARIRPCGFGADVMTELGAHLDPVPPSDALRAALAAAVADALGLAWDGTIRTLEVAALAAALDAGAVAGGGEPNAETRGV
jgi:lipoyl(octanoyl) transferase